MHVIRIARTIFIAALASALAACSADSSEPVTRKDCERLRDHIIDLRMQSVTVDQDQHRQILRSSMGDTFISPCMESTTEAQLKCALAAADSAALIACDEPTTR